MNWQRLREKVLEEIYPEEEDLEKLKQKYEHIADFIKEEFGQETHFAGSASRGTCMKGDNDIDLFVLFSEDVEEQELEDRGLEIGKAVFREFNGEFEIEYAEHPYTKGEIDGHEVEIVPCYDVAPENIKSSVDRTPHHSRWVEENLDSEQRKDVVILKKFLEANGIYGSSLKTEGFSGYLCEILVAEYGSFRQLLSEARNWRRNHVVDPENHHEELPEKLEKKFSDEPLRVIDSVDPERNVASVLSLENFSRFIYLCWQFDRDPGMDFFREEKKEFSEFEIKQEVKRRNDFLVIDFRTPGEVEDIIYPQLRKILKVLRKQLEKHDFRLFESGFCVGERTRIFFELDRKLPEVEEVRGPSVFHGEEHLKQFRSKYENTYIEEDRLKAKTEREFTDAKKFLENFLDGEPGELEEKGVPGHVAEDMADYSFVEPVSGNQNWLNYLGETLHVDTHDRSS